MDENTTPDTFAAMTAAYAKRINATHNEIAIVWWNSQYPKSKAKLQAATLEFVKKYPVEAFRDEEWVRSTMNWWKEQVGPAVQIIDGALA